ncbi:Os12g0562477, partial [Oryza sativa Japonica Group]
MLDNHTVSLQIDSCYMIFPSRSRMCTDCPSDCNTLPPRRQRRLVRRRRRRAAPRRDRLRPPPLRGGGGAAELGHLLLELRLPHLQLPDLLQELLAARLHLRRRRRRRH